MKKKEGNQLVINQTQQKYAKSLQRVILKHYINLSRFPKPSPKMA